ncbi:MAG: ATP-binding protein [Fimbriimonadales bacterium]|nr:ATP-binding protein [Fimbriimonadales bacterium]
MRFRDMGVRFRLALVLLFVGLAAILALFAYRSRLNEQEAKGTALEVASRKANKLAAALAAPLYEVSLPSVESLVASEFDNPAVMQIAVREGPDRRLILVYRRLADQPRRVEAVRFRRDWQSREYAVVYQRPGDAGEVLGTVAVWADPALALQDLQARTQKRLIEEVVLVLLLTALAGGIADRLVAQPLSQLGTVLRRTADTAGASVLDTAGTLETFERSLAAVPSRSPEIEESKRSLRMLVQSLVQRQRELEGILGNALGAMACFEIPSFRVLYGNEEFWTKMGSTVADGHAVRELITANTHSDDVEALWATYAEAVSGRVSSVVECRQIGPDGRVERWWRFRLGPFDRDETGRVTGTVLHAIDVTDLRRLQEELERANSQLEEAVEERTRELVEANRELESFAYSVSHDLRAPLRSINGFGRILLEDHADKLDEDAQDCVRRMVAAAERLGALVDALLHLSRVARAEVRRTEVDVSAVAEELLADLREENPDRSVEIVVHPGAFVKADAALTRSVLQNLLSNAWKYTRRRPDARIEVGPCEVCGKPGFFVRDNGVGFEPGLAAQAFKPFQRLHTDKEFEGLGVGLATVQRIVARHDGRIEVQAAPGQGAEFRVTLSP